MLAITSLADIEALRETVEVECKEAAGADGLGKLPDDFWPTYSAFANTRGGFIVLGLKEKNEQFVLRDGVPNAAKLVTNLFNLLNNPQKISANLLSDRDVTISTIEGKNLIIVRVPPGTRKQKPVYVNGNPMQGTYCRLHEGDRPCDQEAVKRMLAEQVEDTRDNRILRGYSLDDLDAESLRVYRQMLRDRVPEHPFLEKDDLEFLRVIGGWRTDRETGHNGLTVAGLLMFGKSQSIQDEFPNYFLDYQERDQPKTHVRWVDRVTIDGTWSGNVFDFYRRVYRKLVNDLKVPFVLQDGQRQDDTPVHVALREALVNTLVHADYTGRASILAVKRPDMFGFRNPGLMRIPLFQALQGGESDGRNRTMQQMFLLIGAGERAGSGIPKIYKGWTDQHWRPPMLYERDTPSEQTLLELRMIDLLPQEVLSGLRERFGEAFDRLSGTERLVVATAAIEQTVTHARLSTICTEHPNDLSRIIRGLVQNGFLEQSGRGRGSVYFLPGTDLPTPEAVFDGGGPAIQGSDLKLLGSDLRLLGSDLKPLGSDLKAEGSEFGSKGPDLPGEGSDHRGRGRCVTGLPHPIIDDLDALDKEFLAELTEAVMLVARSSRVAPNVMNDAICRLCSGRYLTIRVIAKLINRDEDYLRQRVLNPLVEAGLLVRAFPTTPNDPRQAYACPSTPEGGAA